MDYAAFCVCVWHEQCSFWCGVYAGPRRGQAVIDEPLGEEIEDTYGHREYLSCCDSSP